MELDDLKHEWQALDRKLDRSISLNLQLLTESRLRRSKRHLLPLVIFQPLQIALGVALIVFCARFWSANLGSPALWLSGLVLHMVGIALVVDGAMRILLVARINYAAPVLTVQRYLAALRGWEIRSFKWAWVLCWLATPAILVVLAKALAGVDLWEVQPAAVIYTGLGGLIGAALSYGFDRWARGRPLGAHLDRIYLSHSIARAQSALDEIEQFARQ